MNRPLRIILVIILLISCSGCFIPVRGLPGDRDRGGHGDRDDRGGDRDRGHGDRDDRGGHKDRH